MMTAPKKPLGLSFWQLTTPAPMAEAGGRLFVDVTQRLASPASRAGLLELAGKSDPLTGDALQTILQRDGFIRPRPDEGPPGPLFGGAPAPIEADPAIVNRADRAQPGLHRRLGTGQHRGVHRDAVRIPLNAAGLGTEHLDQPTKRLLQIGVGSRASACRTANGVRASCCIARITAVGDSMLSGSPSTSRSKRCRSAPRAAIWASSSARWRAATERRSADGPTSSSAIAAVGTPSLRKTRSAQIRSTSRVTYGRDLWIEIVQSTAETPDSLSARSESSTSFR